MYYSNNIKLAVVYCDELKENAVTNYSVATDIFTEILRNNIADKSWDPAGILTQDLLNTTQMLVSLLNTSQR